MMGWNRMVLKYFRWMRAVRRTCRSNIYDSAKREETGVAGKEAGVREREAGGGGTN